MKDKLRNYIEEIFADAPDTSRVREAKEEMYSNICDKYDDLIREGKSEAAAYNISVSSIGDISELIDELKKEDCGEQGCGERGEDIKTERLFTPEENEAVERYRIRSGILTAIAVTLFILCWVPLVIIATVLDSDIGGTIGVCIMMLMIAAGVAIFIIKPYLKPSCMRSRRASNDDDDDDDDDETVNVDGKKVKSPLRSIISTVWWAFTLVLYFALSFASGAWYITWLIFIISSAVDAVIDGIFSLVMSKGAKRSSIVKIVVWSIVASILVSMLCGSVFASGFNFGFGIMTGEVYEDADEYYVGNREYTENISELDIDWTAGTVRYVKWSGESIKLEESGAGDDRDDFMRSRVVNGRLTVKFVKSGMRFFSSYPEKELTVYIPEYIELNSIDMEVASADIFVGEEGAMLGSIGSIELEGASGRINVFAERVSEISVDTVSGDVTVYSDADIVDVDGVSAKLMLVGKFGSLNLDSVSGEVKVKGEVERVDIDGVSNKVDMTLENTPSNLDIESSSGNVKIALPEDSEGFTATLDSVSGYMTANGSRGDRYTYLSGGASFKFNSVSGNVNITVGN